mgnify:FL=1
MTPDQARALLDGTTPGPWRLHEVKGHPHLRYITTGEGHSGDPTAPVCIPVDVTSREGAANMTLKAAAPDMAHMIAAMRTEYAIEHQHTPGGQWHQVTGWSHEPPLNDGHTLAPDERIVRRYVTTPEEA